MLRLGVRVPPAFVITTDECARFHAGAEQLPRAVLDALPSAMRGLEEATAATFGGGQRPLLVSVRSGAATSMPGMMDTVLNLGITPETRSAIAASAGSGEFAADVADRFRQQFAHVVGTPPPADPWEQLHAAIAAVFRSWRSRRAIAYRRDRGLSEDGGTAVTVQAMVFGNLDDRSGTGVVFSRNPLDGGPDAYGEWLPRGQGEDIVSGRRDALPLDALREELPEVHRELLEVAARLEHERRDVQDIEFTVQGGRLWILQTRAAKRSAIAAARHAVQLAESGVISRREALERADLDRVAAVEASRVDQAPGEGAAPLASGHPAAPGVVTGTVVVDTDEAERRALDGEDIILARPTTDPEDIHAMAVVRGIITDVGGTTSHAAVVSRELGVACVVGCGSGVAAALEGRTITLDAGAGLVFDGRVSTSVGTGERDDAVATLRRWSQERAAVDAPSR